MKSLTCSWPLWFLSLPFLLSGMPLMSASRYIHTLPYPFQKRTFQKIFDPFALSDTFQIRALTHLTLPFSSSSIYQLFIFR